MNAALGVSGYSQHRPVFGSIQDFIYESGSQKFAFLIAPSTYDSYNSYTEGSTTYYITQIGITICSQSNSTLNERQAKFAAVLFGGEYMGNNEWASVFLYNGELTDTNNDQYEPYELLRQRNLAASASYAKYDYTNFKYLIAYSKNSPSMIYDDYIYIRGAPESSIWNTDGSSTDFAIILPRNKAYGSISTSENTFLTEKTHATKASLNSMRLMRLYITDKDNNQLTFDDDYILQLKIMFQL